MQAYAERLGGRLIVEPTGPVRGASVTGAARLSSEGGRDGPGPGHDEERGCGRGASAYRGGEAGLRQVTERGKSKEDVNLTQREKEILVSFCRGMSYAAIAETRGVKVVTIRNAIYTIQVKLGVDSKQEVVVWPAQSGLLDD